MNDFRTAAGLGVHTAALMALAGAAVLLSGQPFLFPSLGPSAYVLAVMPRAETSRPPIVLGGHAIGVVAGLTSYTLLGHGLLAIDPPGVLAADALWLTASAAVSVGLTTAGMRATRFQHPPACATTLIVSLGLLSTVREGLIILCSVALLLLAEELLDKLDLREAVTGSG